MKSLPTMWRPKVTCIEEANGLNKFSLENLISSLKSHEIEHIGYEPTTKSKSIALKSDGKSAKALQDLESEEETQEVDSEDGFDVEENDFYDQETSISQQEEEHVSREK